MAEGQQPLRSAGRPHDGWLYNEVLCVRPTPPTMTTSTISNGLWRQGVGVINPTAGLSADPQAVEGGSAFVLSHPLLSDKGAGSSKAASANASASASASHPALTA